MVLGRYREIFTNSMEVRNKAIKKIFDSDTIDWSKIFNRVIYSNLHNCIRIKSVLKRV